MIRVTQTRRWFLRTILSGLGAWTSGPRSSAAASGELALPETVPVVRFDFEAHGVAGWTIVDGQWTVEEMPDAPSGRRVLVQRAVKNEFNVIVAPPGPFTDMDVSVRFKPIAGREDASGGIVFRFGQGRYYVVRANALEGNVRLYYYDGGRRQLASTRVKPPAIGQWHTMRLVTIGDRMQAWLDGALSVDHRDSRFKAGRVGLWTKADSITAFDDLIIRGIK
jgi:3-keto-disaccharide hydrolase